MDQPEWRINLDVMTGLSEGLSTNNSTSRLRFQAFVRKCAV